MVAYLKHNSVLIWYRMTHYYCVDRNKEVLIKIIINFTQCCAYRKVQNIIEIILVCRYLDILELLPLQHTPGILKSLVVISVLALAITFERSDMSRGEHFSSIRSLLYKRLLLGEKPLIMYCSLLETGVMPIDISLESLIFGYVNFKHLLTYAILTCINFTCAKFHDTLNFIL
jgi:hypothetical protein